MTYPSAVKRLIAMRPIFKYDTIDQYDRDRPKPLKAYVDLMVEHLKKKYPDDSDEKIREFVQNTILSKMNNRRCDVLTHPRYGVTERKVIRLTDYIAGIKDDIITPSGTTYMPPTKKRSVLSTVMSDNVKKRKVFKKKQLEAGAKGESAFEQLYLLLQASVKIQNNSIPGAMGAVASVLYDLPGYNAITSTARQSVMTGYGQTERMLGANIYVTTLEDVINYCTIFAKACDKDRVRRVLNSNIHPVAYPTVDQVATFFLDCLQFYGNVEPLKNKLYEYLGRLEKEVLAFVYYGYCLKNLLLANDSLMKSFLKNFFRRDVYVDPNWDPNEISSFDGDLLNMATSLNFDMINRIPEMHDAIKETPDGVRQLIGVCKHMLNCLDEWRDLFETFFRVDVDLPKVTAQPRMIRRVVLVSDTDSVIFTTKDLVNWYAPDEHFTQNCYDANAFLVFMVSQSLEHIFARLSSGFGMVGDDRKKIAMKNEFFYPVFIRTTAKKHYLGIIAIQEGKILPKLKNDIKGVNFRGSDLPKTTQDASVKYILDTLGIIKDKPTIDASDITGPVVRHEQLIYKSLMAGEKEFLPTTPLKHEHEYKDPLVSDYFYYLFWQEVMADTYGEFVLPNKGSVIPLIGGAIKSPEYHAMLQEKAPDILIRLKAFMAKYPKKNITRIIMPQTLPAIPDIFRPVMDARSIIFKNGRPFYLLMQSFNLAVNDTKCSYLVSDFYDTSGVEIPF